MQNYSFLMSVYKSEEPAALTLSMDSMLAQTHAPEQIVVVKDGPLTPELDAVLERYAREHGSVLTVVGYEQNMGLAYALNFGLEACRNELVARMDSDDYSAPTRCEKQVAAFENDPELAIVGTNMGYFDGNVDHVAQDVRVYPVGEEEIRKTMRRYSPFSHPSVMYRRSAVLGCGGYDASLRRRQDMDLFARMLLHEGMKATNIQEPLLLFRRDESYYKRNKNVESCNNRIAVQKRMYKRGDCSLVDYLYVWTVMTVSKLVPNKLYAAIYSVLKNKKR